MVTRKKSLVLAEASWLTDAAMIDRFRIPLQQPVRQVLVCGGTSVVANPPSNATVSADLYDPATNRFTRTGSMSKARLSHVAVPIVLRSAFAIGGLPQTLVAGGLPPLDKNELSLLLTFGFATSAGPSGVAGVEPDGDGGNLRAAFTADGRALLTWNGFFGGFGAHAATFPLAGGHLDRLRLGAQVRPVVSAR